MQAILLYFWRLCLLRESPARIPSSLGLAVLATTIYFFVGMLSFAVSRSDITLATTVGVSAVSVVIEFTGLYSLLLFKQYQSRIYATATAVFTCNSLFLIALSPVNYMLADLGTGLTSDIVNTLSMLSLFWWLTIIGFILKQAASISIFQGVVLAFVIELLVAITIRSAFSDFFLNS